MVFQDWLVGLTLEKGKIGQVLHVPGEVPLCCQNDELMHLIIICEFVDNMGMKDSEQSELRA